MKTNHYPPPKVGTFIKYHIPANRLVKNGRQLGSSNMWYSLFILGSSGYARVVALYDDVIEVASLRSGGRSFLPYENVVGHYTRPRFNKGDKVASSDGKYLGVVERRNGKWEYLIRGRGYLKWYRYSDILELKEYNEDS